MKNKIFKIFLIVVSLTIIIGCGLYFYNSYNSGKREVEYHEIKGTGDTMTKGQTVAAFAEAYINKLNSLQTTSGYGSHKYIAVYNESTRNEGYTGTPSYLQVNNGSSLYSCLITYDCASFVDYVYTKSLCLSSNNDSPFTSDGRPATVRDFYRNTDSEGEYLNPAFSIAYQIRLPDHTLTDDEARTYAEVIYDNAQPGDIVIAVGQHSVIYLGKKNGVHTVAEFSSGILNVSQQKMGYGLTPGADVVVRNKGTKNWVVLRYKQAEDAVDCNCTATAKLPNSVINQATSNYQASCVANPKTTVLEQNTCDNNYTITVHHYVKGTTTPVHVDQTITGTSSTTYNTSSFLSSELDTPYKNVYAWDGIVPSNASGNISSNIEVIYYYSADCPAYQNDPSVLFEKIGHYAFATAGNNNANRGPSHSAANYSWINSNPSNATYPSGYPAPSYAWNSVSNQLSAQGISSFTNMSGSYLNNSGKILKATLSCFASSNNSTLGPYNGRLLIIKPDGTFNIINISNQGPSFTIDITSYIENQSKGWYFVSFVDGQIVPQTAWGITAIYEDQSLPLSYIKLIKPDYFLENGTETTVLFESQYKLVDSFQLIGVILGGGVSSFTESGRTEDRVWAKLKDGSEYQLYDRGDGHFIGRTSTDFANDTFNTIRSHNIQGGEIDIFDETLTKSYFGNKEPIGYRFKKDGSNSINVSIVGLRQEVKAPNMNITTRISPRTNFAPGTQMTITTTVTNNIASDNECHTAYDQIISSSVHEDLGTPTNITLTYDGRNYTAAYNSLTKKVVGTNIIEVECGKPIVLTYKAVVKNSINNHIVNDNYHLNTTATSEYSLIRCDDARAIINATDNVESPAVAQLTVYHYKKGTEEEIPGCAMEQTDAYMGQSYEANTCGNLGDYEFKGEYAIAAGTGSYNSARQKVTGTHTISKSAGGTVVKFYYELKKYKLTVQHLKLGRNNSTGEFIKTSTKVYEPDYEENNITVGTSYNASPQIKDTNSLMSPYTGKFQYEETDEVISGNISGDTVVKLFYKPSTTTVIVRYIDKDTNQRVNSENVDYTYNSDVYYDDVFLMTPTSHKIANNVVTPTVNIPYKYIFDHIEVTGGTETTISDDSVIGRVDGNPTTITFYYEKQTAILNVYHYKLRRNNDGTYSKTEEQAPGTTHELNQAIEIDSNHNVLPSSSISDGYYFQFAEYTNPNNVTTTLTNAYYELSGIEANKVYTFKYYYAEPLAKVTTRYLNCDTGVMVADSVEEEIPYTGGYSGAKEENLAGYNYKGARYTLYPQYPDRAALESGDTVTTSEYRVDYCYKKQYKLEVKYVNSITNELIETPATITNQEDGDHYTTVKKEFANYVYTSMEGTDDGYINANTVDANGIVHVVYKYLPTYSLTVRHVRCSDSYELHEPSVENDIAHGTQYTVSHIDIAGYHHVSPESPRQVTIESDTTVEFCYAPNDYPVTENYIDCDSKESIHQSHTDNYTYLSTQTFNKIDIENYTFGRVETNIENPVYSSEVAGRVTVTIPIVEENNPATVTYCYNKKKATLIVHHENCATTPHTTVAPDDPELEVEWGDRYSTSAKVIENYVNTSDSGNTSGPVDETTVVNNRIVVTYCYGKQAGSLTVKYLEDGSDAVIIPAHEETPLEYGTSYNARNYKENIPNWEYVRVAGNEEGTISGNVTVTYYYRRTIGNLTVHYVDSVTREEIATSENRQWPLGEDYSTIPYIKVIPNYTFTNSHEGAETGTMGDPTSDVHVTYLYTKAGVQLVVRYIDMDTGEEFPNSGVTNNSLHYGDHYETVQKEFPYYRFVRVDKPTSGYIYNQLVITYSYRRNTGIVRAYYRDIETQQEIAVREDQEIPYEGHYDTVQKEIAKYNFERSDGVTSGTLLTDEVEVTYFYRKQRGKVITRHFDRTNNTQFGNDIVQEYKLDDRYVTSSMQIDNYELVATPDNYVGIVTSTTPIIVNYYYDQLKGVVITRYLDEDTKEELLPTSRIGYNYGDRYSTIKRTIDNYTWTRTDGIENGTVGENQIVVTYYYKINIGRLTVEHLESGTNRNLAEPIVHDYPYGTSYETRREIFENYEFVNVSGVESGKIYGNVVVRYYYKLKDATITVNYLDERDHAVHLKDTEVYNVKWGDNYLFNSVRIENFDYVREDGDPERGVVDGSKVINYYYNRRQANLVVHHLESGTERILANEDREIVYYGLNYTTNSKTIPGYKMDASLRPDNAYGIVDGDIDVTYYYDRKEAEVITTYIDRKTGSPLLPPDIVGYNYGDTYTTIEREIDNYELVDIDGAPTGKVRKDVTEVIYYYERRVGNITIKYLDETDLTELYPTIHKEINYGEDYTSDEKQFGGYELSRIDGTPSGKVDGDKIVIYYYKKKAATLIVQYLELVTNEALHAETVTPHKYGDTYQTVKLDITNYDFVMVDGVTNGTIDRDIVTVIYYYERHKANIIARYIEEGTNNEVAPPQTQEVGLGKYYVTTSSGAVPPNYELVRKTDNYEGIARQDEIEVFYYYRKVDSDLVTKITKVGIEEISSKDDFVDYEINYEARLNDYIGTATVTITDKLPYQIDIERSSLDGGTYNPYKNTIEWVIPFDDDDLNDEYGSIDTYSGDDTIMITKYVSLKYVGIDATERTMVNTVTGKIKISNNQKEVSDNLITRISIPGTIIVHHYLKGTTEELVPDEYNEGLVGETYISSPQELEGYRVVTRPTNETHVFGENLQEVVYEYERIKFNLDVEVIGGIGDITGTEEIFYGDDSTPENIVITPGEGYEIEKIIINGVSYEVDNREGMTLDNFINVQENIKVEVEFTEKPLPVPITGSESKLIVVALILIILTIMFVAYKVGFISKLLKR